MAIYKRDSGRALDTNSVGERISNQVVLTGADPEILVPKGVFLLETLVVEATESVELIDGNSVSMGSGIKGTINAQIAPIVCDRGLTIDGKVVIAVGYTLNGIYHD